MKKQPLLTLPPPLLRPIPHCAPVSRSCLLSSWCPPAPDPARNLNGMGRPRLRPAVSSSSCSSIRSSNCCAPWRVPGNPEETGKVAGPEVERGRNGGWAATRALPRRRGRASLAAVRPRQGLFNNRPGIYGWGSRQPRGEPGDLTGQRMRLGRCGPGHLPPASRNLPGPTRGGGWKHRPRFELLGKITPFRPYHPAVLRRPPTRSLHVSHLPEWGGVDK